MNGAIDPIERCEQLTAENAALRAACNKREEDLLCVCEKNEKESNILTGIYNKESILSFGKI